jgi:cell division septation protein DedD
VLNLTQVQEGPFLAGSAGNPTFFAGNSKQLWDNNNGLIDGGLTEALSVEGTSSASFGVLATLTFLVTGTGTSHITIAGGNLRANSSDTVGVNVTCNSATIVVTSNGVSSNSSPTPGTGSTNSTPTPSPTGSTQPASAPELQAWTILPILIMALIAALGYRLNKKARYQHSLTYVSSTNQGQVTHNLAKR